MMCIICNCGFEKGNEFLEAFEGARQEMKKAKEAMLKCSRLASDAMAARRYAVTHKKIVRLLRDWNRLEEFREGNSNNQDACGTRRRYDSRMS